MEQVSKITKVFFVGLCFLLLSVVSYAQISFVNVKEDIGVQIGRNPNTSTWGDIDNDGDLDLYICPGGGDQTDYILMI